MKRLTKISIMLLLFVGVMFTSCDKDDTVVVDPAVEFGEVSFNIENYINELASKNAVKLTEDITCTDLTPSFVNVSLTGPDGSADYEIDLVTLVEAGGKMQSEVLKLTPGAYTITDFAVYHRGATPADDVVLFASPESTSEYVTNWGMIGVDLDFTVEAFKKAPVEIDVLCYVPSDYKEFGFTWFQFKKFKSKKIYFFGDVCTKFWEDWNTAGDASTNPYFGNISGFDFVADFKVDVYKGTSTAGDPAVTGVYNSADYIGVAGEPLCIEYIDNVNSVDETYTFVISLRLPDGSYSEIHTGTFTDKDWAIDPLDTTYDATNGASIFGGDDGIFDFVVGNCTYDGTDVSVELPAYIPIPETLTFKYASGNPTYSKLDITSVTNLPAIASQINSGDVMDAWCGNRNLPIYGDTSTIWWPVSKQVEYEYQAAVYSSLDVPAMPSVYSNYGKSWNVLNWLINNKEIFSDASGSFLATYGTDKVQKLIWTIIKKAKDADLAQGDLDAMLADLGVVEADLAGDFAGASFDGIRNFLPSVGDYAIVLLDPYKVKIDTTKSLWTWCGWIALSQRSETVEDNFQLMVVQVDP